MQKRTYPLMSVLFLIILSLACSRALPIMPFPSGKIIYQSDEFGNFDILMIKIGRKRILRLTILNTVTNCGFTLERFGNLIR